MTTAKVSGADLAELGRAIEGSLCRARFEDFARRAWPIVEPARPFVPNAASDAIAEHLQAVGDGQIRRLLVAVSPGVGKSTFASVLFPAWRWAVRPEWRGIFASHAHSLAVRDSLRTRRLVESEWYRGLFATGWKLRADQNRADDFENTRSGRRLAVGVGGALTGSRADHATVDDSLNAVDARSKAIREAVNDWFESALTTRMDAPDVASMVVIQQRLRSDDLIGHLLAAGGWEALILPAEYDPRRRTVTCIWSDPRTEVGELLAPEIHSREFLDEQRRVMGSAGYGCQYGQNPTDDEGGLFQRAWWRFHKPDGTAADGVRRPHGCSDAPAAPLPETFDRVLVSIDCAFKDGAKNDYVVALVLGCKRADRFVLDLRRGKMGFTATQALVKDLAAKYPTAKILIEDAANGPAIINSLKSDVAGLVAVQPDGGKEARASAVSPQVESGNVYLPEGAPWLDDFIDELAGFPRAKHDDQVDALSQALLGASSAKKPPPPSAPPMIFGMGYS